VLSTGIAPWTAHRRCPRARPRAHLAPTWQFASARSLRGRRAGWGQTRVRPCGSDPGARPAGLPMHRGLACELHRLARAEGSVGRGPPWGETRRIAMVTWPHIAAICIAKLALAKTSSKLNLRTGMCPTMRRSSPARTYRSKERPTPEEDFAGDRTGELGCGEGQWTQLFETSRHTTNKPPSA
jgi:hypothetical protein